MNCAVVPDETPEQHWFRCCLFCARISWCQDCVERFGLCPDHVDNPAGTFSWATVKQPAEFGGGYAI